MKTVKLFIFMCVLLLSLVACDTSEDPDAPEQSAVNVNVVIAPQMNLNPAQEAAEIQDVVVPETQEAVTVVMLPGNEYILDDVSTFVFVEECSSTESQEHPFNLISFEYGRACFESADQFCFMEEDPIVIDSCDSEPTTVGSISFIGKIVTLSFD